MRRRDSELRLRARRWALGLCAAAMVLLASAGPAAAYKRTRACSTCPTLFWCERSHVLVLDDRGLSNLSLDSIRDALILSMEAWNVVECSDFEMMYGGEVNGRVVGFDQTAAENENLVIFIEKTGVWRHTDVQIGVTTTSFNPETGKSFDSDIEMNGVDFTFTAEGAAGLTDLRNTLTHELGHFVGLDHSAVEEATMHGSAPPGETRKRDLHPDDIEGICAIYPLDGETPDADCRSGRRVTSGCQCATTGEYTGSLLLLLGGVVLRRRRRSNERTGR